MIAINKLYRIVLY